MGDKKGQNDNKMNNTCIDHPSLQEAGDTISVASENNVDGDK